MGLREIIKIIQQEELCKNWDLDEENENLLSLYYDNFNLHLMYDDGKLITMFHIKINDKEIRERLQRKYIIERQTVYIYKNDFYIQIKYKRFNKQIIWDHTAIYSNVIKNIDLAKNNKKNIIWYPRYNVNVEIMQISNYPILDSELP